jgi:hypothetical protein
MTTTADMLIHKSRAAVQTRTYGVLNACRVLAYLDGQGVLSRPRWPTGHGTTSRRPPATITPGARAYRAGSDEPCAPQEVREFARWAAARALEHEA